MCESDQLGSHKPQFVFSPQSKVDIVASAHIDPAAIREQATNCGIEQFFFKCHDYDEGYFFVEDDLEFLCEYAAGFVDSNDRSMLNFPLFLGDGSLVLTTETIQESVVLTIEVCPSLRKEDLKVWECTIPFAHYRNGWLGVIDSLTDQLPFPIPKRLPRQ